MSSSITCLLHRGTKNLTGVCHMTNIKPLRLQADAWCCCLMHHDMIDGICLFSLPWDSPSHAYSFALCWKRAWTESRSSWNTLGFRVSAVESCSVTCDSSFFVLVRVCRGVTYRGFRGEREKKYRVRMAYRVASRRIKEQEEKKKNKKDPPALQRLVNILIEQNMNCSWGALGEVFPQD